MKSLVLSAMICAAAVGTSVASTHAIRPSEKVKKEHVDDQKNVAAFKQVIAFHQRNVDVLFSQFEIAKEQVHKSRGNHAELDRDKAFFISVYQQDINERSEEHTSELQSRENLVCRLLLEKKKKPKDKRDTSES